MEASVALAGHPLVAGVAAIESALDEMSTSDPMFLPSDAKRDLLLRLARLESRPC